MPESQISTGQLHPENNNGEFNQIQFLFRQALSGVQTAALVIVKEVSGGAVDVSPLVHQVDSQGKTTPHGTIHNLPYCRLQGGVSGIILPPAKGDIGVCVFASRDHSKVKEAKGAAPPGSLRTHDWADGVYIAGVGSTNGDPTQYIEFKSGGITIKADSVTIDGDLSVTGSASVDSDVTISGTATIDGATTAEGTNVHSHIHTGVTVGSGVTGTPSP